MKKYIAKKLKEIGLVMTHFDHHNSFWWHSYHLSVPDGKKGYHNFSGEYHIWETNNGISSKDEFLSQFHEWLEEIKAGHNHSK